MDASTHANRKGEAKNEGKEQGRGRDDLRDEAGAKGRYEGGRDSDQERQAKMPPAGQRHGRDPADVSVGKVAGRMEEEE